MATEFSFQKNQTILFDGDSLTNLRGGGGLSDWPYLRLMNWDRNWANQLAELMFCWYPELNLTMRNVAVGGSTTQDILDRFDAHIKPHKPDWVLMTMCGNDARRLSADKTQANLKRYIERLRNLSGGRLAIIGGFLECPRMPADKKNTQAQRVERDAVIRPTLEENGGCFIDIGAAMQAKAEALYEQWAGHIVYCDVDGHFSNLGSAIIAGEVLRALGYLQP